MKCSDKRKRVMSLERIYQSSLHFVCSFVGKRERNNCLGGDIIIDNKVCDARGYDTGLTRSRAGNNYNGAIVVRYGSVLLTVELLFKKRV